MSQSEANKLSDAELIHKVIDENPEIFGIIIDRYQEPLLRYVRHLIGDAKAEDVVQDTFIKAYTHLRGFNPKHKFSSWIYRIAHNTAMNAVRNNRKFLDLGKLDFDLLGNMQSEMFIPEKDAEKEELQNKLQECLGEIPLKYREVLTLFYLENKKYEEIGEILRIPTSTVGVWLLRGKIKLRKACEAKGIKE